MRMCILCTHNVILKIMGLQRRSFNGSNLRLLCNVYHVSFLPFLVNGQRDLHSVKQASAKPSSDTCCQDRKSAPGHLMPFLYFTEVGSHISETNFFPVIPKKPRL